MSVDVALGGVGHLADPDRGVDQPAQDRLLADDLGVEAGVGRHRHALQQVVQVRRAADPHQLAALAQLGRDGDRVGRLAPPVQVDDGVVDLLVGRPVEVGAAQHLDDVGDGVLGHHHRAEHALLGHHVLRRRPIARPDPSLRVPRPDREASLQSGVTEASLTIRGPRRRRSSLSNTCSSLLREGLTLWRQAPQLDDSGSPYADPAEGGIASSTAAVDNRLSTVWDTRRGCAPAGHKPGDSEQRGLTLCL